MKNLFIGSLVLLAFLPLTTSALSTSQPLDCPVISQNLERFACDASVSSGSCKRSIPGTQVAQLQKFLMSYFPANTALEASGKYLSGTRQAVIDFQLKTGVISSTSSGGAGKVGPATRAKIAELCSPWVTADPAPRTSPQTGSCKVGNETIPNGEKRYVYIGERGNGTPGSRSTCRSMSITATCTNGTMLGLALGETSLFKYTRCYDDEVSDTTLESLISTQYLNQLGRMPDAEGLAYWKAQIRSRAVTMDDLERNLKQVAQEGTDAGATPQPQPPTATAPAPIISSFSATQSKISAGQSSTLVWSASNSTLNDGGCYILANPGSSSATITAAGNWGFSGRHIVTPSVSTTYTLKCFAGWKDGSRTAERTTTVTVQSTQQPTQEPKTSDDTPTTSSNTRTSVEGFYSTILRRTPDAAGVNYWVGEIEAGRFTLEKLRIQFHVTYLYRSILGREPDAPGLSYWVNEVLSGRNTIDGVRRNFEWCFAIPVGQPNSCKSASAADSNQLASVYAALQAILAQIEALR